MGDFADAVLWIMRLVLAAGLAWGGWLFVGRLMSPARREKAPGMEQFAAFALLVLLATTLGGFLHAG